MKHHNPPQFFLTIENDCPYLEGQKERKVFAHLAEPEAQKVQNALSEVGFRRSQNIIYRPACRACSKCLSIRILANEFEPSKSQKRILAKNKVITREVRQSLATDEQYELFTRYLNSRHLFGGMTGMSESEYSDMVGECAVSSRIVEYRISDDSGRPGALVGCVLTDIVDNGVSMVYSFFDPELSSHSMGTYMILDHIKLCKISGFNYLYLGYWVKNSPSMDYKRKFSSSEIYINGHWRHVVNFDAIEPEHVDSQHLLLEAHRKLLGVKSIIR